MSIADDIKARIDMLSVLEVYGFQLNKSGFMVCPFHNEKTASFSLFDESRRGKCFGCGWSGDVVAFVMELYHISFRQAIVRIDNDFGLHLLNTPAARQKSVFETRDIRAEQKEKARKKACRLAELNRLSEYRRNLHFLTLALKKPRNRSELLNVTFALSEIARIDYEIDRKMKEGGRD